MQCAKERFEESPTTLISFAAFLPRFRLTSCGSNNMLTRIFLNISVFFVHACRYTVNMGGSSKEEPYSLTFADGLCDNDWHSVRITRDHRRLYLHFDSEQKNVTIKEPRFQNRNTLLLDFEYYVGGGRKSKYEYRSAMVKNFVGCLGDVLFNAVHSISEAQRNLSGYVIEGNVMFDCPPSTYEPITFTNNKAVLRIPTAHAQHKVRKMFSSICIC